MASEKMLARMSEKVSEITSGMASELAKGSLLENTMAMVWGTP
jgi:hypothetical protein